MAGIDPMGAKVAAARKEYVALPTSQRHHRPLHVITGLDPVICRRTSLD
jgi:hypothetical protein